MPGLIAKNAPPVVQAETSVDIEKKIKNVKKKLKQIKDIKEKIDLGLEVELTQLQKVDNEAILWKELSGLEKLRFENV